MALKNRILELKLEKALKERRDITNAQLARELGVSSQAVDQWINQKTNPGYHLEAVCRYFKVLPSEVLYLDPPLGKEEVAEPEPQSY